VNQFIAVRETVFAHHAATFCFLGTGVTSVEMAPIRELFIVVMQDVV
jgi:hypothetical protein